MFWKVAGYSTASPVDNILDQKEFALEDLLDEDDLIQECRSLNGRLINFLGNKENVEALLKYMMKEPTEEEGNEAERERRLAWQSCEVFCCEVDPIFSVLLENEDTMTVFFAALDVKGPLHAITAGYFGRVMAHLLLRKPVQLTLFLQQHKEYVFSLIDHLEDTSITDVVVRLMGADEQTNGQLPPSYMAWMSKTEALVKIMDRLDTSELKRVQFNAAQVLIAIVRQQSSVLANLLADNQHMDHLLQFIVGEDGEISVPVLSVIIAAVDPRRNVYNGLQSMQGSDTDDFVGVALFQPLFLKLAALLAVFAKKLRIDETADEQRTPYGTLTPPLGPARLKIIEVVAIMMTVQTEELMDAVIQSKVLQACMDLFLSYPYNNILHKQVVSIFISGVNSGHQPMLDFLFDELNLCKWLTEVPQTVASTETTNYIPHEAGPHENGGSAKQHGKPQSRRTLRAGYLGHANMLSNHIIRAAESNAYIAETLMENKDWQKYVSNVVMPVNRKEDLVAWACGRPSMGIGGDAGCIDRGDLDFRSAVNGALRQSHPIDDEDNEEDDEEEREEEDEQEDGASSPWRTVNELTSDKNEVTATAAMFARMGLREAASRNANRISDSSSSSSSSSSSDGSSSSSTTSSEDECEEEGQSLTVISVQNPVPHLAVDFDSGSGRGDAEKETSTSEAHRDNPSPPPDDFNAFNYWKLDISPSDLPEPSIE